MTTDFLPDQSTPFGQRVRERLREEKVIWLTTVSASGTPQPNPVWFIWDGSDVLIYNDHAARRLAGIRDRPRVSLHFNSDAEGDDVVVLTGQAEIDEQAPLPHESAEYLAKYRDDMVRVVGSTEAFSRTYSVLMRVRITRVRGV